VVAGGVGVDLPATDAGIQPVPRRSPLPLQVAISFQRGDNLQLLNMLPG